MVTRLYNWIINIALVALLTILVVFILAINIAIGILLWDQISPFIQEVIING